MLFLNNDDVKSVLNMEVTMQALDESYLKMIKGDAVCRPRIDGDGPHCLDSLSIELSSEPAY